MRKRRPRRGADGRRARAAASTLGVLGLLAAALTATPAAAARPVPVVPTAGTVGTVGTARSAAPAAAPALGAEAAEARARLAGNLDAAHPGRPEALTHARADDLAAGVAAGSSSRSRTAHGAVPTAGAASVVGLDVADYQGNVDWQEVAAAGESFAYVKATEGTYYTDSTYFAEQYDGSRAAGLVRGAYHFAIPDNSTGAAQADYFVANGGGWTSDGATLPGLLDIEYNPYGATCYGLTHRQMVAWVASFDREYRYLTGRFPDLYTTAAWWDECTGGSDVAHLDPLTVADYGPSPLPLPRGWSGYAIWQYTSDDALGTDGDVLHGDRADLVALALGRTSTDAIATGRSLVAGQRITAPDRRYYVAMQPDGNLVDYTAAGRAVWSSRTAGHRGADVVMQPDGNLVVYAPTGRALWDSGTFRVRRSFAAIGDDGDLVVSTDRTDEPVWTSARRG
jgi:GH25 family lysozyme M1 (1,4-beta-N-acetylmuramidase)